MRPLLLRRALRETGLLLKGAARLWSAKHAFQLAAALAFYTLFSMAPLLIIVITMTGVVFGEEAARGEIAAQIEELIGPQAAAAVEEAIRRSQIQEAGLLPTLLGVGLVLFGATTVFAQMQASLNQIWDVTARPSRSGIVVFLVRRLLSFGMVLVIGFLLLVSFLATTVLAATVRFAREWVPIPAGLVTTVDALASLAVATLLFAMLFKILPDVWIAWRDVWRGAFLTAVLFVLGQYMISVYLTVAGPASAYGAAGSLVMVLMWVYYSSLILFFGACFIRVLIRRRGDVILPSAAAVKVRTEIVEELGD